MEVPGAAAAADTDCVADGGATLDWSHKNQRESHDPFELSDGRVPGEKVLLLDDSLRPVDRGTPSSGNPLLGLQVAGEEWTGVRSARQKACC